MMRVNLGFIESVTCLREGNLASFYYNKKCSQVNLCFGKFFANIFLSLQPLKKIEGLVCSSKNLKIPNCYEKYHITQTRTNYEKSIRLCRSSLATGHRLYDDNFFTRLTKKKKVFLNCLETFPSSFSCL